MDNTAACYRSLTHTERRLLACLQAASGQVVNYTELAAAHWFAGTSSQHAPVDPQQRITIRAHIKGIRRKLTEYGVDGCITTHPVVGYSYDGPAIVPMPAPADPNTILLPIPRAWAANAAELKVYVYEKAPNGPARFVDLIPFKMVNGQPVLAIRE